MTKYSNKLGAVTRRHFLFTGSVSAGALMLMAQRPLSSGDGSGFFPKANAGSTDGNHSFPSDNFTRRDVRFTSTGAELHGWLYEPKTQSRFPLVVMAHGYSATKRMTADKYAKTFCAQGLAVLLYDHHGFGDSGGEPRRQINTWVQARGYLDAIAFARKLPSINAARIAVWGDSLSGGVAIVVASIDPRLAALVIQVPAIGSALPPPDPDGSVFRQLRDTVLSGTVEPTGPGEMEGPMPVVSDDPIRHPCALQPLTAYRWFIEYGGRFGSGWFNDVTRARPRTPAPWHPGLCASHVSCPSLFVVSPNDEMPGAVAAVSRAAFDKISAPKEWSEIEGGHFGLLYFPSPEFDHASSVQAQFLSNHLLKGQ